MERAYIDELNRTYDGYFKHYKGTAAVVEIDTDDLDFVRYPEDLTHIENRVRQTLKLHPFQPELPLE